jgi:hypothetical protein
LIILLLLAAGQVAGIAQLMLPLVLAVVAGVY